MSWIDMYLLNENDDPNPSLKRSRAGAVLDNAALRLARTPKFMRILVGPMHGIPVSHKHRTRRRRIIDSLSAKAAKDKGLLPEKPGFGSIQWANRETSVGQGGENWDTSWFNKDRKSPIKEDRKGMRAVREAVDYTREFHIPGNKNREIPGAKKRTKNQRLDRQIDGDLWVDSWPKILKALASKRSDRLKMIKNAANKQVK